MIKIGCFALVSPFSPLEAQFQAIRERGFDGPTTLEIFGDDAVKVSAERLQQWFA